MLTTGSQTCQFQVQALNLVEPAADDHVALCVASQRCCESLSTWWSELHDRGKLGLGSLRTLSLLSDLGVWLYLSCLRWDLTGLR
jgi:hypothetical protein